MGGKNQPSVCKISYPASWSYLIWDLGQAVRLQENIEDRGREGKLVAGWQGCKQRKKEKWEVMMQRGERIFQGTGHGCCASVTPVLGRQTGGTLWLTGQPSSQIGGLLVQWETMSQNTRWRMIEKDTQYWFLASTHTRTNMHAYRHTQEHMSTHLNRRTQHIPMHAYTQIN